MDDDEPSKPAHASIESSVAGNNPENNSGSQGAKVTTKKPDTATPYKKKATFIDKALLIPFGRFSLDTERTGSAHEQLVGRESERAFLIDALIAKGRQGAYLVTGRRGVGKSSFVNSCISEYQEAVFHRFMRLGRARSLGSILTLLFFAAVVICFVTALSKLMELIAPSVHYAQIRWFVVLLYSLIPIGLTWYSAKCFIITFEMFNLRNKRLLAFLSFLIITPALYKHGFVASPSVALSKGLFVLSVIGAIGFMVPAMYIEAPKSFTKRVLYEIPNAILILVSVGFVFVYDILGFREHVFAFGLNSYFIEGGQFLLTDLPAFIRNYNFENKVDSNTVPDWLYTSTLLGRNSVIYHMSSAAVIVSSFLLSRGLMTILFNLIKSEVTSKRLTLAKIKKWLVNQVVSWRDRLFPNAYAPQEPLTSPNRIATKNIRYENGLIYCGFSVTSLITACTPVFLSDVSTAPYIIKIVSLTAVCTVSFIIAKCIQTLLYKWLIWYRGQKLDKYISDVKNEIKGYPENGCKVEKRIAESNLAIRELKRARNNMRNAVSVAPVELLIFVKGILILVIAMQLAYPLIGSIAEPGKLVGANVDRIKDVQFMKRQVHLNIAPPRQLSQGPYTELIRGLEEKNHDDDSKSSDVVFRPHLYTLFSGKNREEAIWILLFLSILSLIYFLEYEWINRAMVFERDSSTLNHGPADNRLLQHPLSYSWRSSSARTIPPHEPLDRSETIRTFRRIEKISLPYLYCRLWLPSIVIKVNLGFDSLDHKGVIQSMMYSLRDKYRNQFIGASTPYFYLTRFLYLIVSCVIVKSVSESYIDFSLPVKNWESRSIYNLHVPQTFSWELENLDRIENNTDYCGAFQDINIANEKILSSTQNLLTNESYPINKSNYFLCDSFKSTINTILPILFTELFSINAPYEVIRNDVHAQRGIVFPLNSIDQEYGPVVATDRPNSFISLFLHYNNGLPSISIDDIGSNKAIDRAELSFSPTLSFRLYHLIVFILTYFLVRTAANAFRFTPYSANLERINELYDALQLSYTERSTKEHWGPAKWIRALFTSEVSAEKHREALDPRSVELAFIDLMEEIQESSNHLLGSIPVTGSIPAPEITFVFDELDKITGGVGADHSSKGSIEEESLTLDEERKRSYALHTLLSDMKRIITSAPARFIFVGNRLLHDEWIADQGRREPLLTSIFDGEIYLRSLLMDHPHTLRVKKSLTYRIEEYLFHIYKRSIYLQHKRAAIHSSPMLSLESESKGIPEFVEDHLPIIENRYIDFFDIPASNNLEPLNIVDWDLPHFGKGLNDQPGTNVYWENQSRFGPDKDWKNELLEQYINFLAYRSVGNPKKLRELISRQIRPAGRFGRMDYNNTDIVNNVSRDFHHLDAKDVIYLPSTEIYRIQLLDSIFNVIVSHFEEHLLNRDDKVVVNLLYILDFVMKFHRRGFSWHNLERVDELAHIHRAPDLRVVLEELIEHSTDIFIQKLLNGLYGFRFRSEVAYELRYLSRISPYDMSSFNFSLDESQSLKARYTELLENESNPNIDILLGLAELYEYDQEYDSARKYYFQALKSIDSNHADVVGQRIPVSDPVSILQESLSTEVALDGLAEKRLLASLSGHYPGQELVTPYSALMMRDTAASDIVTSYVPWGLMRLRIMLQVGMSYELGHDYERAKVHYHNCSQFSKALLCSMLYQNSVKENDSLNLVKDTNILYQAFFAEGWVAEKIEGAVDTSISIVEEALLWIRQQTPFGDPGTPISQLNDPGGKKFKPVSHSNIALVLGELHDKAGDLYFLKGNSNSNSKSLTDTRSRTGFLQRANYHYLIALHEVRRFVVYRRTISGRKLGLEKNHDESDAKLPIAKGAWPSFVYQSIHSSLADLADSMLAQLSVVDLWNDLADSQYNDSHSWLLTSPGVTTKDTARVVYRFFEEWFETDNLDFNLDVDKKYSLLIAHLRIIMGRWNTNSRKFRKNSYPRLVKFKTVDGIGYSEIRSADILIIVLLMQTVSAKFLAKSGTTDNAANELVMTSDVCGRYIKWFRTIAILKERKSETEMRPLDVKHACFIFALSRLSIYIIDEYEKYCKRTNAKAYQRTNHKIGNVVSLDAASSVMNHIFHCDASIHYIDDNWAEAENLRNAMKILRTKYTSYIRNWFHDDGEGSQLKHAANYDRFQNGNSTIDTHLGARSVLTYLCSRHKFPARSNLILLKNIVDDIVLDSVKTPENPHISDRQSDALRYMDALIQGESEYDASMHFTPLMIAETAALITILIDNVDDKYKHIAFDRIVRSKQMTMMGREYYKTISRMHYLYDDFNDRRLHLNHAMMMSGSDMMLIFRKIIG